MVNKSAKRGDMGWARRLSLVLAVMCAGILSLQTWRWARGHGHWYDLSLSAGLVFVLLANAFEGSTKYVLLIISLPVLIAAIVMLSIRL
jgi:uncharacterized membrane protein YphA (DoxX/SURF4 family)